MKFYIFIIIKAKYIVDVRITLWIIMITDHNLQWIIIYTIVIHNHNIYRGLRWFQKTVGTFLLSILSSRTKYNSFTCKLYTAQQSFMWICASKSYL